MLRPVYTTQCVKAAFHLRYTWTGWPTAGTSFPAEPGRDLFTQLDHAWQTDDLRRIAMTWSPDRIQLTFSATPQISPTLFASRVKGRLQHAMRAAGAPVNFSRKVGFRAIGENHTAEVESYIENQVKKEKFVDSRFAGFLKRFTTADEQVDLTKPFASNSGRYWYNLHVVLVAGARHRTTAEEQFIKLDRSIAATAHKHGYAMSIRSLMPDHVHIALRGNIEESPEEIALALMNNTAFAMGQNAIWQNGYYVGSFSEYDVNAVRSRDSSSLPDKPARGR